MTGTVIPLTIFDVAKPGRRQGTPSEWRLAFIRATRKARDDSGLSQSEMASELSRLANRPVPQDTYRKWEKEDEEGAMLPHDLIVPFCDVARVHIMDLLRPIPFLKAAKDRDALKKRAS